MADQKRMAVQQAIEALRAVLAGSRRSSNGRMGSWATPTMAVMEQADAALAALVAANGVEGRKP